jgi:16S rRNA (cytosine967-C5)-methyltransferase
LKNLDQKISARQTALLGELLNLSLREVLEKGHPADRLLARFFKNRRELGSRDRRFLSEAVFSFFRWLGWSRPLGLTPPEAAALGWMLDQTDVHPVIAGLAHPGWHPAGDRTLDQKLLLLTEWFPAAADLKKSDLVFPRFETSVQRPAGREESFYETLQQRPPTWIRLRSDDFRETLSEAGIPFCGHAQIPGAVSIPAGRSLGALGHGGQYEVQDIASQAVALSAAPESGSDWWDACAGAGGKALHLADLIGPDGKVLATDTRENALRQCKKRARADGISTLRLQPHNLAQDEPFTKQFDGVLVDAPCSGWGTWSRNPDARWRSDPRDPAQKRNLQLRMLDKAAQCVKPGGVLLYAVCTFTREETVEVIESFCADHSGFAPDAFSNPLTGEPTGGSLQIWPWDGPGDGMFIARLRRHRQEACV